MKINVNCEIYDLPTTRCLISGAKYVYFNLKKPRHFFSSSIQVETKLNA